MAKSKLFYGWHFSLGKYYNQAWVDDIGNHVTVVLKREITPAEFAMPLIQLDRLYPHIGHSAWVDGHSTEG